MLIRYATGDSTISLITDNKVVKDKYIEGQQVAAKSVNNDLYHELFRTLLKKNIILEVTWMPSH